jgi:hypothetical protein
MKQPVHGLILNGILTVLAVIFVTAPGASGADLQRGLRPGDLIFVSMNCFACKLIEETTHSPYSHVGIINFRAQDRFGHGLWTVIMAVEPKVTEAPLTWFLQHVNGTPKFMRLNLPETTAVAAAAEKYLGRPYDLDFIPGDQKLYCSELIYFSFLKVFGAETPFKLAPMNFEPFVEQWSSLLGHAPPQGLPGINPGQIANSQALEQIFP